MTSGFFTSDQEPALALEVRGPEGSRSFEAVIDTGFNGALTLPPAWIDTLGLAQTGEAPVVLADGSHLVSPVYTGYVILDENAHQASVAEAPTPLVGTSLLWGSSLFIEFQSGGAIEVEFLPQSTS